MSKRILLVDDKPDQIEMRQLLLESAGHTVVTANTREQALGFLPADDIVMDLRIPTLDEGLTLIRELRDRAPQSKKIVLSGWTQSLEGRPEKDMVDHILQKPVRSQTLLALLLVTACSAFGEIGSRTIDAHAPILERRANARGSDTDTPLLLYAERLKDKDGEYIQYTVIFSNEDGGTSTRALMARWGRTTDIEHVYRVWVDDAGKRKKALIQAKDHKDVEFEGPFESDHPVLRVITDNNMVGPGNNSPPRTRLKPEVVDLSECSREQVMDDHPEIYRIAAEELRREGKLKLIGDPRQYLYIEAEIKNAGTRMAAWVRLNDGKRWYSSHAGRFDWAIERSGFIRTTVQLPAGTSAAHVAEIGFGCLADDKTPADAGCEVARITKAFFLDQLYKPGKSFWKSAAQAKIGPGETAAWPVK
ncbi:MAG: response regulator [Bryobacteraceae bacterium]